MVVLLQIIPCLGDEALGAAVLLHGVIHVLLDQLLHLWSHDSHSNTSSNLTQQHHYHQHGERTQHADILLLGSAAPKEGNYQDDGAQDDEANSRGLKLAIKELQVRAEEDLGDDPYRNQDDPGQEEDEIEDEDQVLDREWATS